MAKGMFNLTAIRVIAPAETAFKKLYRAKIPFYDLDTRRGTTTFCVTGNNVKKVFAIFSHPCYNVCVVKRGTAAVLRRTLAARIGVLLGALLFTAAVCVSQLWVFKIEVTGSGAHLAPQVTAILAESGAQAGKPLNNFDKPLAISRIMSLPGVTFCSVQRSGSRVEVDVECGGQSMQKPSPLPLVSPVSGVVQKIVAVCGTPAAEVGQSVKAGQKLILPVFTSASGEVLSCICAGYAHILCRAEVVTHAEEAGESAAREAVAAALLYTDEPFDVVCSVRPDTQGVVYTVQFSYICKASINLQ